jgi:NADH-quinone oxidoreductase subunit F
MRKLTDRILAGQASSEDIDLLVQVANQIEGKTVCAFGEAAAWPTQAMVAKFREEFEALTKPINALLPHNPEAKEQLKFLVRE